MGGAGKVSTGQGMGDLPVDQDYLPILQEPSCPLGEEAKDPESNHTRKVDPRRGGDGLEKDRRSGLCMRRV